MRPLFLLRWSARDLRRRWLQVVAIALIIAVGTGVYAALGSTATWRRESNDASFEALHMYDLRVKAAEGLDAAAGAMRAALDRLPDPGVVAESEERLVVPTQVDASTSSKTILVPGRLIGVDVADGGPRINSVWVSSGDGRTLTSADDEAGTVVLERNFASFYDLPSAGSLRVAGSKVDYVGEGLSPEYFFVVTDDGSFFAEANFAAVFAPLGTAQTLSGRAGRVNDLVIRLRPGTDVTAAKGQVLEAFSDSGLAVTVMQRSDEDAYRLLYDDIESDQKFWNVFALLIVAGAAFGAFNLASRMVEAQRREIGIGMALGANPRVLALRPLLVGIEIALLGVVFGVGMGLAV
jgi:putative ABC transport system permease protein